jgi:exodeoxyribonuclease VII small subunit
VTDAVPPPADVETLAYDDAFAELGRVVATLESGGQSLEATIELYERAVALQGRCERLLAVAELRVRQLLARADGSQALAELRAEESGA